jgi:5-aminolevulinate synthase
MASVKWLKDHLELRTKHQERANTLKHMLVERGMEIHPNACTHIVPVMVRDPFKCKAMSDTLLNDYGIYIQPINWPTVPEGTERLRIAPTPFHTDAMMNDLVDALERIK